MKPGAGRYSLDPVAPALHLDPATERTLDDLVASGRFTTRKAAIREGLRLVQAEEDGVDTSPLTPAELAGVQRGLADVAAGRVHGIDEVKAYLARRHAAGM